MTWDDMEWRCEGRRAVVLGLALLIVAIGVDAVVQAAERMALQDAEPTSTTCAQVLTRDAAVVIVGDTYAGPVVTEYRPGFTECQWQGDGTNFGFAFTDARALADDMHTADEAFETDVSAVENADRKRELLSGIGIKAALVDLGDEAMLLEVVRADGVARMIAYKVAREQAIALARAIGAP